MFFGKLLRAPIEKRLSSADLLRDAVRAHLPEADQDALRVVVALCGLLASVAYADRTYSDAEQAHVREALARVHGLDAAGLDAICLLLRDHVRELAVINPQAFARDLREHDELELRREVLDVLVDLAAADGELVLSETNLLRRTTTALGLTPDDYVVSQGRHRDKLGALR
jgi:uncharacterized tellurite resistance protein B-like protein